MPNSGDRVLHTPTPPTHLSAPLWQLLQVVADLLQAVWRGQSLTHQLELVAPALRPGAQALAFEVLRHLGTAQAVRRHLAPRRPAAAVDALLCVSLALLCVEEGPYRAFTLVDQATESAKRRRHTRAQAGFVNACLRRFLRETEACLAATSSDRVARWNHPTWWIERLRRDHPDDWETLLAANQRPASLDLRVHAGHMTAQRYCEVLAQAGLAGEPLGGAAVRLQRPVPVRDIPGHAEGWVSVQSFTAQRAVPLLLGGLDRSELRVLDACAAPGGKTAHLLEWAPHARVTALEVDGMRSQRITDNLARLRLQAQVCVADAGQPARWWDGQPYDAILLDAPCSASGIVRRHPDVRWLRRDSDIAQLAQQQDRLLDGLWPLLVSGGRLLFSTCSVFREEGQIRIDAFLARNSDARELSSPGHLLPTRAAASPLDGDNRACDEDGFFYALLEKRAP